MTFHPTNLPPPHPLSLPLGPMSEERKRMRKRKRKIMAAAVSLVTLSALAQPVVVVPPQRDPLINMMMAQPKIDLSAPVKATAVFDPPILGKGQQGPFRVTFNTFEE